MAKNEYPLLHVYPQPRPSQPVKIVGNTEGIMTLVTALIEATSIAGQGIAEAVCADGEVFEIQISRDDSESAMETLELPYAEKQQ